MTLKRSGSWVGWIIEVEPNMRNPDGQVIGDKGLHLGQWGFYRSAYSPVSHRLEAVQQIARWPSVSWQTEPFLLCLNGFAGHFTYDPIDPAYIVTAGF